MILYTSNEFGIKIDTLQVDVIHFIIIFKNV